MTTHKKQILMHNLRVALTLLFLGSLLMAGPACYRDEAAREQVSTSERQQKGLPAKWLAFDDGLAKARTENKPIFANSTLIGAYSAKSSRRRP